MQKLIAIILIFGLLSCSDNIERFVPNDISIIHTELKDISQSKSSSFKLNNNTLSNVNTDNNIDIEIPMNTFYDQSELTDVPYQLDVIELESYADYITSNITQVSDERIRDVVFSIYVSAKDNQDNDLTIKNNNEIIVRVPSPIRIGNLQIGSAYVSNNSIAWSYTNTELNSKIKYTEWTQVNSENVIEQFSGYEFKVSETGWYSLTLINDDPYSLSDICVSINDNTFTEDNTLVYIVLDSHHYLLQAQPTTSNNFCSYNVPITNGPVEIIAISYLENEGEFYYDSMQVDPNQIESSIILSPIMIDPETLISALENL